MRLTSLRCGLLLCGLLTAAPAAQAAETTGVQTPPNPIAAPLTAGWNCQDGRCSYQKTKGTWSACFTGWSPTHGGWKPTLYCR